MGDPETSRRAEDNPQVAASEPLIVMGNLVINTVDVSPVIDRLAAGKEPLIDWLVINGQSFPMKSGLKLSIKTSAPAAPTGGARTRFQEATGESDQAAVDRAEEPGQEACSASTGPIENLLTANSF
jgi:hypothetical protein